MIAGTVHILWNILRFAQFTSITPLVRPAYYKLVLVNCLGLFKSEIWVGRDIISWQALKVKQRIIFQYNELVVHDRYWSFYINITLLVIRKTFLYRSPLPYHLPYPWWYGKTKTIPSQTYISLINPTNKYSCDNKHGFRF